MPEKHAATIDMLIERRHNQSMTQKELAEAASLTQSVIARLESKRAIPPARHSDESRRGTGVQLRTSRAEIILSIFLILATKIKNTSSILVCNRLLIAFTNHSTH